MRKSKVRADRQPGASTHFQQNDYQESQQQQQNELFIPFSQRKYCSVIGSPMESADNFLASYNKEANMSPASFRRRKGSLANFMDRNAWMSKVWLLNGVERSK